MLASFPLFVAWLRAGQRQRSLAYCALGALPFLVNALNLDASLITWPAWQGQANGLTLTIMDTLALAIVIVNRRDPKLPPFLIPLVLYSAAVFITIPFAMVKMAAVFYWFQTLRMIVIFLAVASVAAQPVATRQIGIGLGIGIIFQAVVVGWQSANGAFQAPGTLGHQNLLGIMTHFVNLPLLAILLGGVRNRLLVVAVVSGLLVTALGASRGAIGFGAAGLVTLIALSMMRRSTPTKRKVAAIGMLALLAVSPLMYRALEARRIQIESSRWQGDERAAFERAARAMWADHPMGVGANQYTLVANVGGYNERAGVNWNWTSRSAKVHNTYLLVGAETGVLGFISFIALLGASILGGLRFAFRDRRDPRGDIVLGCTVAIMATAVHILYEWIFVTYQAQYVFAISLGVIAAMMRARERERRMARRPSGDPAATAAAPATQPGLARGPGPMAGANRRPAPPR